MYNPAHTFRASLTFFCSLALLLSASIPTRAQDTPSWSVSALPSSVRIDPVEGDISQNRPDIYQMSPMSELLEENWSYDAEQYDKARIELGNMIEKAAVTAPSQR